MSNSTNNATRNTSKSDRSTSKPSNGLCLKKIGHLNYSYSLIQKSQALIENSRLRLEKAYQTSKILNLEQSFQFLD